MEGARGRRPEAGGGGERGKEGKRERGKERKEGGGRGKVGGGCLEKSFKSSGFSDSPDSVGREREVKAIRALKSNNVES